jgi:hypothetical protein
MGETRWLAAKVYYLTCFVRVKMIIIHAVGAVVEQWEASAHVLWWPGADRGVRGVALLKCLPVPLHDCGRGTLPRLDGVGRRCGCVRPRCGGRCELRPASVAAFLSEISILVRAV